MADTLNLQGEGTSWTFAVRVAPRAKRRGVVGLHGDAMKIAVHAPPVDGAANEELVAVLSKSLGVAKGQVHIERGHRGRDKVVRVEGVKRETLVGLIGD